MKMTVSPCRPSAVQPASEPGAIATIALAHAPGAGERSRRSGGSERRRDTAQGEHRQGRSGAGTPAHEPTRAGSITIDDPIEMEKAADALPIEQVAKRWIVASDPDEAVAKVKDYVDWGLNHLVFHAPGHDQRRFLELFARDLEPRLRKLG